MRPFAVDVTVSKKRQMPSSGGGRTIKKVEGGWVVRDSRTGRFTEVQTDKGTSRASDTSAAAVVRASNQRSEALKRLADR